jgi:hypothetical protein
LIELVGCVAGNRALPAVIVAGLCAPFKVLAERVRLAK